MKPIKIILSCEHAVNTIPKAYAHYFRNYKLLLNTHRGLDIGALGVATSLSQSFNYPLFCPTVSRMLIDCNRSLGHQNCFSELVKDLSSDEKNNLIQRYYLPFRQQIQQLIQDNINQGYQVWHLSIHSFTPVLNGIIRNIDIGFLYDPKRADEQKIARSWQRLLKQDTNQLKTRLNYPYRGISDGFTTALRKKYPAEEYVGIEIECNQRLTQQANTLAKLNTSLIHTFALLLKSVTPAC